MCRQDSRVHLSAEEEIAAEESLSIYCKPVELYNILQRRAVGNPSFLQRCLRYKIQAKHKRRIQMTISLPGSTYDGVQAQSPFPLYILLARPISDIALAEYPAVYRFNRACILTSSTRVDGSHQAQANFILPDISKLAMESKSGSLTILIVKCAESKESISGFGLPKDIMDMAPFSRWGHCPPPIYAFCWEPVSYYLEFGTWWRKDFRNSSLWIYPSRVGALERKLHMVNWSIVVASESASRLDSPFTEKEIYKAIFQLDRDKAPGPDGSTIAVFQDCWNVIKEDLVRVFAEFHSSGIINQSTNASFIVLLPKKSMKKKISDYRPISLIISLYKIIAKVLSGYLRGVLHETIHSTQGTFVQGRQILDAVLIANEIVDEKRRSGEEEVVFKIDFEKAYDHVCWDFLDHVLEKKGFSPRWRKWMRDCLSTVSFAVLVNGNAIGMLLRAEERNLLEGFKVGRNSTRVNLDKSNIYGINLEQNHFSRLAELLDCKVFGWLIPYLGLPLGGNPKTCGFWDPVIERISRRLDG
ncbi:Polycomb group protein EMBRYONIC FLOWER 2 [Vitis vinifera]|uniref:Polycomb group protein EMBRYONIC FLOWER 2 n=1 Tax=Vitis vinifera TaxID=29760 RepID=A0A438CXU0_VITVI|nr:Polycomb group protein EMBRYONIC FLOWER 2 [Vitis vinifera]